MTEYQLTANFIEIPVQEEKQTRRCQPWNISQPSVSSHFSRSAMTSYRAFDPVPSRPRQFSYFSPLSPFFSSFFSFSSFSSFCPLAPMIIWMGLCFAIDHTDRPAFCKWSSRLAGLSQMIIWMGRPFANDHSDGPALCNYHVMAGLVQMIIRKGWPFSNDHPDRQAFCLSHQDSENIANC